MFKSTVLFYKTTKTQSQCRPEEFTLKRIKMFDHLKHPGRTELFEDQVQMFILLFLCVCRWNGWRMRRLLIQRTIGISTSLSIIIWSSNRPGFQTRPTTRAWLRTSLQRDAVPQLQSSSMVSAFLQRFAFALYKIHFIKQNIKCGDDVAFFILKSTTVMKPQYNNVTLLSSSLCFSAGFCVHASIFLLHYICFSLYTTLQMSTVVGFTFRAICF